MCLFKLCGRCETDVVQLNRADAFEMRGAPKVTFVVCGDGYRAVVDNLMKGFNSLSVADIAKKAFIGKVSRVRTSRRAAFTGMSTFLEVSVILFSMTFSLACV